MASRLSLAPLTINEAGPLELISAAAAGGFDAVAMRVIGPPGKAAASPKTRAKPYPPAFRE